MVVVMMVFMFMLMFIVVIVVIVVIIVVVVVMFMLLFIVIIVVIVVVVMVVMVFVILRLELLSEPFHFGVQRILFLHGGENGLAVKFRPRRGNDRRRRVLFLQHSDASRQFFFGDPVGMRKNDTASIRHLIVEKFAEILHVHLALARVDDRAESVQFRVRQIRARHRFDHVAQFTDAGRLDHDPVGVVFFGNFLQRLCEIPDEGTANASRIHFGNINARVLQKAAVYPDLAKFVFDQNDLLSRVRLFNQLFNECGFACPQKA
jgi:hypothetical protein